MPERNGISSVAYWGFNRVAGHGERFRPGGKSTKLVSNVYPVPDTARQLDLMLTPEEHGLKVGEPFHFKDLTGKRPSDLKTIRDLLSESPTPMTLQDVIELQVIPTKAQQCSIFLKTLTGKVITLPFSVDTTVYELKRLIQGREGIPPRSNNTRSCRK